MRADKRACFALIAATFINNRCYNSVYDYLSGRYINISSSGVNSNYISFFDYNRGGYVSGNNSSMYDYPTSSYVTITINNHTVNCFDYETSSYVVFTVNSNGVSVFDYQTSSNFNYNVF